jgi:pimeloyl-ACP methyl ester carboxylesterase
MAKAKTRDIADYIVPLNMNGMHGRMLRLPPSSNKKREMLLIYGHHASLERMFGLAEDLSQYGTVTMPDLPGFGGMQPFYSIGEKPTLDNLADYLAALVKMQYKRKRVTILGVSFGFLVVTRMLQKHPELTRKVDLVVSIVGFVHHEDFKFKKRDLQISKQLSKFLSAKSASLIVRHVFLRKSFIRATYLLVADRHVKMKDADAAERRKRIDFEIVLWHINDVRTYMHTTHTMLTVNLCDKRINLPVQHIAVDDDRYFNNLLVEQHLNVIYSSVTVMKTPMEGHAPTVIADAKAAAPFVPPQLRRILRAAV